VFAVGVSAEEPLALQLLSLLALAERWAPGVRAGGLRVYCIAPSLSPRQRVYIASFLGELLNMHLL